MEGPPREKCRLSCKLDVKLARSASLEGGRAGKEPNTKICLDGSCLKPESGLQRWFVLPKSGGLGRCGSRRG